MGWYQRRVHGITFLDRTSTSKSVTFVSPFDLSVAHTHSSPEDITFIPSSSLLTTLSRRNERQPLELLHFKNSQTSKYVRRQDSLCLGRCCQRCCCSSYPCRRGCCYHQAMGWPWLPLVVGVYREHDAHYHCCHRGHRDPRSGCRC